LSAWRVGAALAGSLLCGTAEAGPPYLTDDPEPVDLGHWEIYGFAQGTFVRGASSSLLPAVEVNYGALPELQLHVVAPLSLSSGGGVPGQYGVGDTQFGFKYRLADPGKTDWFPQIGIFPMLVVPSGNAARGLGTGRVHAFLPVWIQKDFWGTWTTDFGGGTWINPGPGNRNYWYAGWLVTHQVTEHLAIGAEIFHQTASSTAVAGQVGFPAGTRDSTGFNVGAVYDFTEHHHLLLSGGRGLQNVDATNQFSYYAGYQFTF
jgi:hypothetical protein